MATPAQSVLITDWTLAALSLLFVVGRCCVRLFKLRLPLSLSDYLVVFGWIDIVVSATLDTEIYFSNGFDLNSKTKQAAGIEDAEAAIRLQKITYAATFFYDIGLYFFKFSFLAFYNQWISYAFPKLRIAFYILTAYVCVACVTVLILGLTWCQPISGNWSLDPAVCHNFQDIRLPTIVWALNVSSDIFIFTLPFFLLPYLKLQRSSFYSTMVVFLLGLLTIAATTMKFVILSTTVNAPVIFILYAIELNTSVIVTCLPALKNVLFSTWNSLFSSSGGKKSHMSASTDVESPAQEMTLPHMDNTETTVKGLRMEESRLSNSSLYELEKPHSVERQQVAAEVRGSEESESRGLDAARE